MGLCYYSLSRSNVVSYPVFVDIKRLVGILGRSYDPNFRIMADRTGSAMTSIDSLCGRIPIGHLFATNVGQITSQWDLYNYLMLGLKSNFFFTF